MERGWGRGCDARHAIIDAHRLSERLSPLNLEQERARAQQALRLLDDPLFKEAREDVYAQLRM